MSKRSSLIGVKYNYKLNHPNQMEAYFVLKSDLNRLRKEIKNLDSPPSAFLTIGSLLLGVAATSLVGALTLQYVTDYRVLICWALFGCSFICGTFSLLLHCKFQKKYFNAAKNNVLNLIDDIVK